MPFKEIMRMKREITDSFFLSEILSDIFRINILYMIMRAGSGHLGTSFSCIDIVTWLFTQEMAYPNELNGKGGDLFFSSKGHDSPALYAVLMGLGKIDFEYIHKFRRLGGLPGHPDIDTPHMITNTGSLGMGISKAYGMAKARRLKREKGSIYVLTGDGELQEGQIWESLQPTANAGFEEIIVIVDHNKIQSDMLVCDTSDLGHIEEKFRAFGWDVRRCDGHNLKKIDETLRYFKTIKGKPHVLIADTIKGKGISFMEFIKSDDLYGFHSGAPTGAQFLDGIREILLRINQRLAVAGYGPIVLNSRQAQPKLNAEAPQKLIGAYGDELISIARERNTVVALDADLVKDTGLVEFKKLFPERYIECGIAEQHMVSIAGGLALQGLIPVVHSFAAFLATRPNEQIFNNATEKTKIIYVGSLAGILPATPGHSHQMVRDISCLASIPGLTMVEPASETEARNAIRWAVENNLESTYIRLVSIPVQISFSLPKDYKLQKGKGINIKEGNDIAIIGYGPVMLEQGYKASLSLEEQGISTAVFNFPWLNFVDQEWLADCLKSFKMVVVIDDHFEDSGVGTLIAGAFAKSRGGGNPDLLTFGVRGIPVCGNNDEVLDYHGLDHRSLAQRIESAFQYIRPPA